MEFQIEGQDSLLRADLIRNKGNGELLLKINDKDYSLKLLKSGSNEFEFFLGNKFHYVKILKSQELKYRIFVDGTIIEIKKHSKITEIIEKSLKTKGIANQANNVASQIPGRVVKISVSKGDTINEGDPIVILESMKMQIAIKAHKNGVLKDLKVREGSTVSRNDVVATIE